MNKAALWSVKGVDFDAREAAREAARRAGMSLGEWLNDVIAEQAHDMGVSIDDVDEEGRLEAVTARLASLSGRGRRQSRRYDPDDATPPRRRPINARPRIDIRETPYDADARDRSRSGGSVANPEALLDAAIRAYERGADRTDRAGEAMARMADRLEEIGKRLDRRPEDNSARSHRASVDDRDDEKLARLEARLEALARDKETERSERSLREIERRFEEMASRFSAPRPENKPTDEVGRIESKLNRLIEKIETREEPKPADSPVARLRAPRPPAPRRLDEDTRREDEPSRRLDDAVARIARRQRALDDQSVEPAPVPAPAPAPARPSQQTTEMRDEIARILRKLDETQQMLASRDSVRAAPPAPPPQDAAVSALGQEVANLNKRVSDAVRAIAERREAPTAPRQDPALSAMQREIADLSRRIDEANAAMLARLDKRATEAVQPLEGALRDLGQRVDQTIRETAPRQDKTLAAMQRDIADLSRRIEDAHSAMLARLDRRASDSVAPIEGALRELGQRFDKSIRESTREDLLKPIADMTADIRHALEKFAPSHAIENVERAVRDLRARIDQGRDGAIDANAMAAIQAQTNDIRELLQRAMTRAPGIETIERQIARLTERLDAGGRLSATATAADAAPVAVEAGGGSAMIELLASRIDQLSQKLDEALSQSGAVDQIDDLARRIDDVHRSLNSRLDNLPERTESSQPIERMLGEIAAKLDRPAASAAALVDAVDTSQVESMLREIAGRFDERNDGLDKTALDQLGRDVARLTQVVESLGKSSVDASFIDEMRQDFANLATRVSAAPARGPSGSEFQEVVEALAERLDKFDDGARAISRLESSIADISRKIEDAQQLAIDAAHAAARDAAQMTIDEALSRMPSRAAPEGAAPDDFADLRAMQEATDRRTYSTLSAVHETLEKVVDRIAVLEDEIGGAKSVAAPARAPSPAVEAPRPPSPDAPLAMGDMPRFAPAVDVAPPRPSVAATTAALPHDDEDLPEDPVFDPAQAVLNPKRPSAEPAPAAAVKAEPPPAAVISERKSWLEGVRQQARANVAATPARGEKPARGADKKGADKAEPEGDGTDARARAMAAHKAWAAGQGGDAKSASGGRARSFLASPRRAVIVAGVASLLLFSAFMFSKHFSRPTAPPEGSDIAAAPPRVAEPPAAAPGAPAVAPVPPAAPQTPPPDAAAPGQKQHGAALDTSRQSVADAQAGASVDRSPVSSINPGPANAAGAPRPAHAGGLQAAAEEGDPAAQYELGSRYADGRTVAKDPARAVEWLTKAAQQHLAPAAYRLGSLYERGVAGDRDLGKARDWYTTAANAGNVRAMHNLAVISAEGVDGKPDYAAAANWFKRAAEYGVRDSQYNLAILYARGLGVEQNLPRSWGWFAIAAAQGDTDAAKKQEDVGSRLDSQQLSEAKAFVAGFHAKTPDKMTNEVATPPGGWDVPSARMDAKPNMFPAPPAITVSPPPLMKSPTKKKVTSL